MDVGAGSGLLSLFAAQAGAKKVYAVEASGTSAHARTLVEGNDLNHIVRIIGNGRLKWCRRKWRTLMTSIW